MTKGSKVYNLLNLKRLSFLIFVLIFNLWIGRVFTFNFFLGTLLILSSIFLLVATHSNQKKYLYLVFISTSLLLFFQWKTTLKNPLTFLNQIEQFTQYERFRAYPPVLIPVGNWLELRKEATAFYKIKANLSESLDLNLYFFANHPRERVGVTEVEKFPYILLPAFILGIFSIGKKKLGITLLSFTPLFLISLIGNSNPIGPFSLFPAIAVLTSVGLEKMIFKKSYLIPSVILFALVFIQTYAYAIY